MLLAFPRRLTCFAVLGFLVLTSLIPFQNARAASALAAWSLGKDGVLRFRTAKGARIKAFFQAPQGNKGTRVWIDFPGELIRPRKLIGNGPVKEIRLGKPTAGVTRFVVEFLPSISLNPRSLQLVGTSSNLWKLDFVGLPTKGLKPISEGDLNTYSVARRSTPSRFNDSHFSVRSLPSVPKGRYRVVIDPGHGGPDSGAVGIRGIRETDVVLDVSLQVAELLKAKGVLVSLTRTTEVDLDLPPRVAMANRLKATAFVSIHANASRSPRRDVSGIETFYYVGSRAFKLASNIQKEVLIVSPGSPDRGVRRGRFFVIRRTYMPAALVEIGFLSGRLDASRLATSTHRRKLAFAISKGILKYLQEVS